MKKSVIAILLLAITAQGRQRLLPEKTIAQSLPGTVTLSLVEFNRLVELAEAAARKPKPPAAPVPFILSRAVFALRVENESVFGSLNVDGDVLQKGPTRVDIATGLTILEAQQSQAPLPLLKEGATHAAIVNGPGAFSISMKVACEVTVDAGRASFSVQAPTAGSALLTLDMPGNHANVHVEPGLITNRGTSNGRTIIDAALEPGKPAKIWWTTREAAAPVTQRELRFLSDVKTLISAGDSQLRIAALCDVTVVQGEPTEFRLPLPSGYEVTEASGATLDSSEIQSGVLILKVREPSRRTHQFLVAIERPNADNKLDAPFLTLIGAQRETGEVLVEGVGTMDLTAKEEGGLRRIDVRETGAVARSLSHFPLQAAFRYHRRPGDAPKLALEWSQFPDSPVLSAIAERATITTLLNVEGKTLTEVTLRVRNHAQPFVKVGLPRGASLLSAEVEGEKVKPVLGSDGSRVPLLRTGFRPSGAYTVSFVYLSSGAPFAKNGSYEMGLPKLDIPISFSSWEVFLPDRLEVRQFAGNALSASVVAARPQEVFAAVGQDSDGLEAERAAVAVTDLGRLEAGQIGGVVVDQAGAIISGAKISILNTQTNVARSTSTDGEGRWVVSGVPQGPVRVKVDAQGFKSLQQELNFDASHSAMLGSTLEIGATTETVNVTAGAASLLDRTEMKIDQAARRVREAQLNSPSQNVFNLQRKVAGILPVRVDVPHAGKSYRFVRALVMDEETKITFQYKSK